MCFACVFQQEGTIATGIPAAHAPLVASERDLTLTTNVSGGTYMASVKQFSTDIYVQVCSVP